MNISMNIHPVTSRAGLTLLAGMLAMSLAVGCGGGDNNEENNATENNSTENNSTENNSTENNTSTNNTSTNNTSTNNTSTNNTSTNNTSTNNTSTNNTSTNNTSTNNTSTNNTSTNNTSTNNTSMAEARLQVLHLADGAGTVDIYVNDALLIDDLDEKAGTNFFKAPAEAALKIDVVGGDAADNSAPVYTVELADGLAADGTYIVAATGDVAAAEGADEAFRLVAIPGALSANDNADTVKTMVIHGVDDAPTVDVVVDNGDKASPAIADLEFAGYTNDGSGNAAYLDLDPTMTLFGGPAVLDVNVAATDATAAAFQTPDLNGLAGSSVVIAATGSLTDGTFGLTAFVASEGDTPETSAGLALDAAARLQVIHNSADPAAATVDVYAGDSLLLIDDFAFRTATPFLTVPSGTEIPLNIAAPDATDGTNPVVGPVPVTLEAGSTTIAVASGVVGGEGDAAFALLTTEGKEANDDADNIQVKVHHGSPDTPAVGVRPEGAAMNLIDSFAYGEFVGYVPLATTTNTVLEIINPADGDAVVVKTGAAIDFSAFTTPITVLASGSSGLVADVFTAGSTPEAIALIAVDANGDVAVVPLVAP